MITKLYSIFIKSTGISTDTRTVQKGNLFFALSGENFNGNQFAKQAIEKGAILSVIDDEAYQSDNTLLVKNALTTLQQLAKYHRKQLNIPIIALTGSNGKTTTKELINAVLSQKFNTSATLGNLNNHIGVPLTLLAMTNKTEIGIVEMGANHPKEIEMLCHIACPNYGYITNFGKAHLEGFGSLEGVIKAKSELYDYLRNHKQMAFVNLDDDQQVTQSEGIKKYSFSVKEHADVQVKLLSASPNVSISYQGLSISSNLIGAYNFTNIAAAIAIGNYFKIENTLIKQAIEQYYPTNNRSQIINKNNTKIILDAYNANPTSMLAALQNFKNLEAPSKVIFLGDMFELGKNSKQEHQQIVDFVCSLSNIQTFLIGDNFYNTQHPPQVQAFSTFEFFKQHFDVSKIPLKATILIKGSRGMALERILDIL